MIILTFTNKSISITGSQPPPFWSKQMTVNAVNDNFSSYIDKKIIEISDSLMSLEVELEKLLIPRETITYLGDFFDE